MDSVGKNIYLHSNNKFSKRIISYIHVSFLYVTYTNSDIF